MNKCKSLFAGTFLVLTLLSANKTEAFSTPVIDLDPYTDLQTIIDKQPQTYLGHPSSILLEDGKSILCIYPRGHGIGPILMKKSPDKGKTWSDRLLVPESWWHSREIPTFFRLKDQNGKNRIFIFGGRYPATYIISEDDGNTWSDLKPMGDWGGMSLFSSMLEFKEPGHYMGFFQSAIGQSSDKLNTSETFDGGLTWTEPADICPFHNITPSEPCVIRSPKDNTIALLFRENSRKYPSQIMFSHNEAKTWSSPKPLPHELVGDRHTAVYLPDGRLYISFRDNQPRESTSNFEFDWVKSAYSPTQGDWIAWVGTFQDLVDGTSGQYRIRLKDNKTDGDSAYPTITVFPDGEILNITYGHWEVDQNPYEIAVRFNIALTDKLYQDLISNISSEKPKDTQAITLPDDIKMTWCPAGRFMMGSPENELGRDPDENQHEVILTQDFFIATYETRMADFTKITGLEPVQWDGIGPDYPVRYISHEQAQLYCDKLTERERSAGHIDDNWKYTLPTEAQWEYACRAGTTTALNTGKNLTAFDKCPNMYEAGWYYFDCKAEDSCHVVGTRKPNAWGIHDMHGNAPEWCSDYYLPDYYRTSKLMFDPDGPTLGPRYVVRGGSWRLYARRCRAASRAADDPDGKMYGATVRPVLVRCSHLITK